VTGAEVGRLLITGGAALVVVGLVMVWASTVRASRRRPRVRLVPGLSGALTGTALAGGVITGVEWAVVSRTGSAVVWTVALGLPALLAGATMTRLVRLIGAGSRQWYMSRRRRRGLR
jgi:hypothetical protein